jgi:integrase
MRFEDFVSKIYLPFYKRKWKDSSYASNRDRISSGLTPILGDRTLTSFFREELQELLDDRVRNGASHSTVSHLRWDLKQIFDLAVAEGYVPANPAKLLYVDREAKRPERRTMNIEEVKKCLTVLSSEEALRGRLVVKFALLAGMRPGEILALQWGCLSERYADIQRRVYRGRIDSPKSVHSNRRVALPQGMSEDIRAWRKLAIDTRPDAWVFPSEKLTTPVSRDNLWRRDIQPHLEKVGLGWANFQVMRRTHSSLMNELNVDPKVVADQLGHTLDVNQNVYTQAGLHRRQAAVDTLESALGNSLMEQTEHKAPVH